MSMQLLALLCLIYFAFLFHSTIDGGRFPVYSTFCSGSYYVAFSVDI
nr:MAG TPA: hypothetical protein [Caudoviricetes sp.]